MHKTDNHLPISQWLSPRYWLLWLALGLLRLLSLLSLTWQEKIAGLFGWILYRVAPSRRRVCRINITQAYPDYSDAQVKALIKASYKSAALALFEMALAWWASRDYLRSITTVAGMEHLEQALAKGKGVILLTGHFTTLELGGILMALYTDLQAVYKKAHNPMFNGFMHYYRNKHLDKAIPNTNPRAFIQALRDGKSVWYAPDQDFSAQDIVFTPFLGGIASTLTSTVRMAAMTGAPVVPYYPRRLENGKGYQLTILPMLDDYPGGDMQLDATRINQSIETMVYANPAQYFWLHKRFKTRPEGEASIY